jgi:tRNA(fMet)-specific endonuclease VapC
MSILETKSGPEYAVLVMNINLHGEANVGVSVVSLHEQFLGAHAQLNASRTAADLIRGYIRLEKLFRNYQTVNLLPFGAAASVAWDGIKSIQIGKMDLRIAAVALANSMTLVTRNMRHFSQIPNLPLADWTK